MINATVIGNLGQDSEWDGEKLRFSIASNRGRGEDKTTTWVGCTMWGRRAEAIAPYLTRGTRVTAIGPLERRDSTDRTFLNLMVDQIEFSGARREEGESEERWFPPPSGSPSPTANPDTPQPPDPFA
jgi:single-strand DNA-binding protein